MNSASIAARYTHATWSTNPMNTNSLAEELFQQLQGAPLQQMSQQLGAGQMQTASAIGAALPLLLGALGKNTAEPQGAEALFGAFQKTTPAWTWAACWVR